MSTKVAVLGANGQVGAELVLLLLGQPGIEVVPVCRNVAGSAFLRWNGVRVRHGLAADPSQAQRLLGDCDAVLHLAAAQGAPRKTRRANEALIENSVRFSAPGAKIVYFSTQMVYGDPRRDVLFRGKSSYGREKLHAERCVRRAGRRHGKDVHVLRLGHVCGAMQNITAYIRDRIAAGPVVMPAGGENASNTVYTVTIAEAVLRILEETVRPGTYDLFSNPQWPWKKVYEYESQQVGIPLEIIPVPQPPPQGFASTLRSRAEASARRLLGGFAASRPVRELGRSVLAALPLGWSERVEAADRRSRARREIAELLRVEAEYDALSWIPLDRRPLAPLSDPSVLMAESRFRLPPLDPRSAFPADLPPSGDGETAVVR